MKEVLFVTLCAVLTLIGLSCQNSQTSNTASPSQEKNQSRHLNDLDLTPYPWPLTTRLETPSPTPSDQTPRDALTVRDLSSDLQAQSITTPGQNIFPRYSPNGRHLIYVSSERTAHKHGEIYRWNFKTKTEKRLTHQDASIFAPIYHPQTGDIFYATATDELKERPEFFIERLKGRMQNKKRQKNPSRVPHWQWSPKEIYRSRADGSQIRRLTQTHGFDGWISFGGAARRLLFSSKRHGDVELYTMSTTGKRLKRITHRTGHDIEAQFSSDGRHIIWTHHTPPQDQTELMVANTLGKNPTRLELPPGWHWMPTWQGRGEWVAFSSNLHDGKTFSIYAFHLKDRCLLRFTNEETADLFPDFHPDKNEIVFSRFSQGRFQSFFIRFPQLKTCKT